MRITSLLTVSAGLAIAPAAFAQNDECANAIALISGSPAAFDTTAATTSSEPWNCGFNTGNDLWYSITSMNGGDIAVDTCGSTFDTVLDAFSGACGALVPLQCDDDTCGSQSAVSFATTMGQTYYVRIGGWNGGVGTGVLSAAESATPPPPTSVTIVSSVPGTYVDISTTGTALGLGDDGEVDILTTIGSTALPAGSVRVGSNGGIRFFGAGPDLEFDNEAIPSTGAFNGGRALLPFWDDFDTDSGVDGEIYWEEVNGVLIIQWEAAEFWPGGTGGVDTATFQVQVFGGTGPMIAQYLYQSVDSARANTGGSATIGFQSGGLDNFEWSLNTSASIMNGTVLSLMDAAGQIGTNYCAAIPNTTGTIGVMAASGSAVVAANDLTLVARDLPINAHGFFLVSSTQAFVVGPGNSVGNLCLGGQIGRYVGPFQIQNSGASGEIMLLIDNQQIPSPTGFLGVVAGDTLNFQAWHRDAITGTAFSNFTNGLEITFL